MKQLSVIVPIYNVEDYLLECLDSINQSIRNIDAEVLLIDDGSKDGSSDIAVEYSKSHPSFLYFRKENGGLSDARNYGAARANGKYIAFVDSDDIVTPNAYENMIRSAECHQVDLVIVNMARFTGNKVWKFTLQNRVCNDLENLVTHVSECENLIFDQTAVNKLIRRSFWEENKFQYPVGFKFEDMVVSLQMHWRAVKVSIVREIGYLYREREGSNLSITQRNDSINNLKDRLEMMEVMIDYVNNEICDEEFKQTLICKMMNFDLMVYMRIIPTLESEKQAVYFSELKDFIRKHFDIRLEHKLFAECRQVYHSLAEGDYERIGKLIDYRKKGFYKATPVIQTEWGYFMDLPRDLFTFSSMDMKDELRWKYPKTDLYKADIRNGVLYIHAACFFPRINQSDKDRSTTKAVLENIITGERIELKTTACHNEKITSQYGFSYNRYLKEVFRYNYDGAGLEVEVDFNKLGKRTGQCEKYALLICYDGECRHGNLILENGKNDLFEYLDHRVILTNEHRIEIMHDSMKRMMFSISELSKTEPCSEGKSFAVYNMQKKRIIPRGEMIWSLEEITEEKERIVIKAGLRGKDIPPGSTPIMVYKNDVLDGDVLISEGVVSEDGCAVFKVEIGCDEFAETLMEGMKLPKILFGGEASDVWSSRDEMAVLEKDDTRISMFNNSRGMLQMNVRRIREEDSDTRDKRRYLKEIASAEFRKEELDDKAIVFSSYMDDMCSPNARDLYEYIDRNYPEYKCIILLKDDKTPIRGNGIRVRNGSREYYHCLATSKYYVYNTKPENAYRKRSGQVDMKLNRGQMEKSGLIDCEKIAQQLLLERRQEDTRSGSSIKQLLKKMFHK